MISTSRPVSLADLPDGGVLDGLASVDVTGREAPLAERRLFGPSDQHELAVYRYEHDGGHLGVQEDYVPAAGAAGSGPAVYLLDDEGVAATRAVAYVRFQHGLLQLLRPMLPARGDAVQCVDRRRGVPI